MQNFYSQISRPGFLSGRDLEIGREAIQVALAAQPHLTTGKGGLHHRNIYPKPLLAANPDLDRPLDEREIPGTAVAIKYLLTQPWKAAPNWTFGASSLLQVYVEEWCGEKVKECEIVAAALYLGVSCEYRKGMTWLAVKTPRIKPARDLAEREIEWMRSERARGRRVPTVEDRERPEIAFLEEHLEEGEPGKGRIYLWEIMEVYRDWCRSKKVRPTNTAWLGKRIMAVFQDVGSRKEWTKSREKRRLVYYAGLQWKGGGESGGRGGGSGEGREGS